MVIFPWTVTYCVLGVGLLPNLQGGVKRTTRVIDRTYHVRIAICGWLVGNSWCKRGPSGRVKPHHCVQSRGGGDNSSNTTVVVAAMTAVWSAVRQ
jgi:hypothetical protein